MTLRDDPAARNITAIVCGCLEEAERREGGVARRTWHVVNRTAFPVVQAGMRRLTSTAIAVLVGAALITACSGSGTETTTAPEDAGPAAEITIADFTFSGASTVNVGDTVEVNNNDTVGHTWTAVDGEFDSSTLSEGDSFEFTFDEAGEFDYFCQIHPQMTGTITVEG